MSEENEALPAVRQLFDKKEKYETLTLSELKKTNIAWADLERSKTTPVAHYELIDKIMDVLTKAGQEPILEHIYATNQAGSTPMRNLEEQYGGVKNILQAWLLRKITGKIYIPRLDHPELRSCIAFSYHDKGIDVAFGQDVRDCTNMSIFGSHILHTWGAGQNTDYKILMETLEKWAANFDKMTEEDRYVIREMQKIKITSERMHQFVGKLLLLANASNSGMKSAIAPVNVSQCSEISKGILMGGQIFIPGMERSLWDFYNDITFVMKANRDTSQSDITSLLTDVSELGNMMMHEFGIVIPEGDVIAIEPEPGNPSTSDLPPDEIF